MSLLLITDKDYIAGLREKTVLKLGRENVTPSNHPNSNFGIMVPSGISVGVYEGRVPNGKPLCIEWTDQGFDSLRQFRLDRTLTKL